MHFLKIYEEKHLTWFDKTVSQTLCGFPCAGKQRQWPRELFARSPVLEKLAREFDPHIKISSIPKIVTIVTLIFRSLKTVNQSTELTTSTEEYDIDVAYKNIDTNIANKK